MREKNNSVCSICGKNYYACNSCKDTMTLQPWKVHTDTSEHYKVFQIVRAYTTGVYTKADAKGKLLNVDLNDLKTFRDNVKEVIKEILDCKNEIDVASDVSETEQDEIEENKLDKTKRKKPVKVVETE